MYDSITSADVPSGSQLVAGYVDGRYRWSDADWALHAGKVLVRIAVDPNTRDGHVLDIENGAAGPLDAPFWARHRRAAGADPTCYVNLSNWQATWDAFTAAGEPLPHWWVALYDNVPSIPVRAVAKQYADSAMTGGHYDASVVEDFWPGVDGGGNMTDDELRAAIKRIYAGPDSLEEMVKADVRVMIEQDPATRDAVRGAIKEKL